MPNTANQPAVVVKGVTKRFNQGFYSLDVLKGIDLVAWKGEILMITGPSGSGKTTLLSIIAGTLSFDEGEVYLFDKSLRDFDAQQTTEFRKRNLGFVFQQYHLIKTLNTKQNIAIPLLLNGENMDTAEKKAIEMLHRVGLKGKENAKTTVLSGGEQQRVAIARALIHQPQMLICDEPTASLDSESGARVMQLLAEIALSKERSLIIVTHDNRIFKYADRIITMEDGLIIGEEQGIPK